MASQVGHESLELLNPFQERMCRSAEGTLVVAVLELVGGRLEVELRRGTAGLQGFARGKLFTFQELTRGGSMKTVGSATETPGQRGT